MNSQMQVILPDIPRIYTAMAEWLACLMCIWEIKKRFTGWKLAGVSVGMILVQSVFLEMTDDAAGVWWAFCMMVAVLLMYLFIYVCCDTNLKDVGYYCARACIVAELAASLEWQFACYIRYDLGGDAAWIQLLCLVGIYGMVFGIMRWIFKKYAKTGEEFSVTNKELFTSVVIAVSVFVLSNMGFAPFDVPFGGKNIVDVFNARTLIDLGGVAIMYAYHVQIVDLRVRHELESMQSILHNQYIQYKQSQDVMDIISFKYHDLKHHIIALRAEENTGKRNAYLDKMEEEIEGYEAQYKTGNKVLDTMLASKNIYCLKNNITMTSVVDGTLFGFMDVMDICSIFGNALDNAIEYEKKVKEQERRLIHVSAFAQKSFLIIRFENYCEDTVDLTRKFPVTTKKDPAFHGYGLKSVQYTVRKYGGEVDVNIQDNWFNLKILIPMKLQEDDAVRTAQEKNGKTV